MHRKVAGKTRDSNSSSMRSPRLARNRMLSFMLSVVYAFAFYLCLFVEDKIS